MVARQTNLAFVRSRSDEDESRGTFAISDHFAEEDRRIVDVGERRVAADPVARHLQRITHRRRRLEAKTPNRLHVAADDDHAAEVLERV